MSSMRPARCCPRPGRAGRVGAKVRTEIGFTTRARHSRRPGRSPAWWRRRRDGRRARRMRRSGRSPIDCPPCGTRKSCSPPSIGRAGRPVCTRIASSAMRARPSRMCCTAGPRRKGPETRTHARASSLMPDAMSGTGGRCPSLARLVARTDRELPALPTRGWRLRWTAAALARALARPLGDIPFADNSAAWARPLHAYFRVFRQEEPGIGAQALQ
jgi:hypothetical protein